MCKFVLVMCLLAMAGDSSAADDDGGLSRGYEKLPHVSDRVLEGQWDLGSQCTGAIISGRRKSYWATVCIINTGCCNGIFGYVLKRSATKGVFVDVNRKITYTIQADGKLRVLTADDSSQALVPWSEESSGPTWKHLEDWQIE
jgi:hypothetical protein